MSRDRMTNAIEAAELEKRIVALEKLAGAADDELKSKADAAAAEEKKVTGVDKVDDGGLASKADATAKADMAAVNQSRPAGPADLKDQGDQNAKANANWPVSEEDKTKVASMLVRLAKEILK